ncbi:MAG: hypothetical protein LBG46_04135 [Elusimicrobiota bacterium]|jgi:hypothetical protein|nr:hypothetical protein [Elusimicrobiota bacterium]
MKATITNQYSVFITNEAGALKKFTSMLFGAGLNIIGLSSDARYDAEVIKFIVEPTSEISTTEISHIVTRAGYTNAKTEVICVEGESKADFIFEISTILGEAGINIDAVYGSCFEGERSRVFIVVDDIERALRILNGNTANQEEKEIEKKPFCSLAIF